jgi:hypothetical protein
MNKAFWKSDWFVGAALSFVLFIAWWEASAPLLESIERDAYDLGVKVSSRDPGDKVVVVAIDDKSIQNIGRWPWSRKVHAAMIDKLTARAPRPSARPCSTPSPKSRPAWSGLREFRSEKPRSSPRPARLSRRAERQNSPPPNSRSTPTHVLGNSFKQAGSVVLGMQFSRASRWASRTSPCPITCCTTPSRKTTSPTRPATSRCRIQTVLANVADRRSSVMPQRAASATW